MGSVKSFLKGCPSQVYILVQQPSLDEHGLSTYAPHLKTALRDPSVETKLVVGEVLGQMAGDCDELKSYIRKMCGAKETKGLHLKDATNEIKNGEVLMMIIDFSGALGSGEELDRETVLRGNGMSPASCPFASPSHPKLATHRC